MTGYEYGNARLHAMKARLLSRKEIETLIESGSLQGLIAALTKTAYHTSVEAALARTTGMDCIVESLHNELVGTLGKIGTYYNEKAGETVALVLRAYDVHNIKAILRGLAHNVPAGEIIAAFLPVGEVKTPLLVELASIRDPRAAIDVIATMRLPLAAPLVNLRSEHPGADVFAMELALDRWHIDETHRHLKSSRSLLADAIKLECDTTNLLTVLRFAHAPNERNFLRDKMGSDDLSQLFLGPGHLPFGLLARAGAQDSVEAALNTMAGTVYESPLHLGLEAYGRSARLGSIEKSLKRYRLERLVDMIPRDPLGIGVVLGYVTLKINEVNNIRWVAQVINAGLKPDAIRAEMEYIP